MMNAHEEVSHIFQEIYHQPPSFVARAPGRVNLIGEHTDYNDGFVLPMAIDRAVWIAFRPRNDSLVKLRLLDFNDDIEFDLQNLTRQESSPVEYIKGVAWALQESGLSLMGFDGVMRGDVPIGAGLSSSAALELAVARTFAQTSGVTWDPRQMARLAQRAENKWVGVNSGIMDQMISAAGEAGHALLIDCRSLETQPAPLPVGTVAVVLDTGARRGLVGAAYNERRQQCEAAAQQLGVPALRDITLEEFTARESELEPIIRKRARHVISENERTLQAMTAMQADDAVTLGKLMNASHDSLRDDFEVSSRELNLMVDIARAQPEYYGARMTGAGFGGCAVALVPDSIVEAFTHTVGQSYKSQSTYTPQLYICRATAGASIIA
jgi:galactokinase